MSSSPAASASPVASSPSTSSDTPAEPDFHSVFIDLFPPQAPFEVESSTLAILNIPTGVSAAMNARLTAIHNMLANIATERESMRAEMEAMKKARLTAMADLHQNLRAGVRGLEDLAQDDRVKLQFHFDEIRRHQDDNQRRLDENA
ncbi:uncharacterized protein RSE6_12177 [Rhynchosporium secalis]|uniref:Uncharacterized protein n=1 Tax=Rhynchosporium secalis TaxID=38038 RepID=A0A1E1MPV8_RHYSE|nr:uncharacterized protein RSE6_12177 [Rhynchosporium secalis]